MKHKLELIVLLLSSGCTSAAPLKTLDDVAHEACGVFFARERSISFVDAAQTFCATEAQLRPFVQGLRLAQRKARIQAEMGF